MGEEGSRVGAGGRLGESVRGGGVLEAGRRSGGGVIGGRSRSEWRAGGCVCGCVFGKRVESGIPKVTCLTGLCEFDVSLWSVGSRPLIEPICFPAVSYSDSMPFGSVGSNSISESVRPSSILAFLRNFSIREGLSPVNNSFLASSISSGDICARRCLFSSSIFCLSPIFFPESNNPRLPYIDSSE